MFDENIETDDIFGDFSINDDEISFTDDVDIPAGEEEIKEDTISEDFDSLENDNIKLQTKINPVDFKNLVKILDFIIREKSSIDSISISKSKLTQSLNSYLMQFDISSIVSDELTLDILNPTKYIKKLRSLNNDNYVQILFDSSKNSFIVTNNEIFIYLPKKDDKLVSNLNKIFEITDFEEICSLKFEKNTRKDIKELASGSGNINLLIKDNLLKVISIPDVGKYILKEHQREKEITKLNIDNSDLALVCSSFLPIDCEEYSFKVVKFKNEKYFTITESLIGNNINVKIIENCSVATSEKSLII
jgi:hypothetical protein